MRGVCRSAVNGANIDASPRPDFRLPREEMLWFASVSHSS